MKNGFTLIELLAVIIILIAILFITIPEIINMSNKSKQSAVIASAELYLDAVDYVIKDEILNNGEMKDGTYYITSSGDLCNIELVDNNCPIDNTLKVEGTGERPNGGAVTILKEDIVSSVMKFDDQKVVKPFGEKSILKAEDDDNEICTLISGDEKEIGSKYACEVKPGVIYNFYVLSYNDENNTVIFDKSKAVTTNLMLDRNVYYDEATGKSGLTDSSHPGYVAWISEEDYGCHENYCSKNDKGPITAMTYLYNATKDWINIPTLNYTYEDANSNNYGYDSFISNNGIATITPLTGTTIVIGTNAYPLRARMPIYSGEEYSEVRGYDRTNGYLYENLDSDDWKYEEGKPTNNIYGIGGYWTLSTSEDIYAWKVYNV